MENYKESIGHALIDATVNAVAIFTLTLGGLILTASNIDTISLRPALVTSSAVALIRFSLRLYQEDGVNLEGMSDITPIPLGKDNSTELWNPREVYNLCKIF